MPTRAGKRHSIAFAPNGTINHVLLLSGPVNRQEEFDGVLVPPFFDQIPNPSKVSFSFLARRLFSFRAIRNWLSAGFLAKRMSDKEFSGNRVLSDTYF